VLTAAGREQITAALPKHLSHISTLMNNALTAEELVAFEAIMRKLRDSVNPCATANSDAPVAAE
jgi:hypothetical protein